MSTSPESTQKKQDELILQIRKMKSALMSKYGRDVRKQWAKRERKTQ